ncbi:MAG: formyltransferase [Deltaproteobacteria bacterium]|nr:formyltransferase [Deltaproteobacteria bacterium]
MRVIVMGYHNIGCVCLKALINLGAEVAAVITHADDPSENLWFGSVKDTAISHGIPVFLPDDPNTPEFIDQLARLQPDFLFSFYYRLMLKPQLLAVPTRGALNLHGSLLPAYRGRVPVNWALINGETRTGVTLHYMDVKPDRGDIVAQKAVDIDIRDTAFTLFGKMTDAAEELISETYPLLVQGTAPRLPQDQTKAFYCRGRRPQDGEINWPHPAIRIYNLIRAVTHPYPGAFTFRRGRKLFIWTAEPPLPGDQPQSRSCLDTPAPSSRSDQALVEPSINPGRILAVDPASGLVVATGQGSLVVTRCQIEGEPELGVLEMVDKLSVTVGEVLG